MRNANAEQKAIILEVIDRIHKENSDPLQIFFTGPAGSGKTFTLKLLMETYNRYTLKHNCYFNCFIACASTGKYKLKIYNKLFFFLIFM